MPKFLGAVLYSGTSAIDGEPIVLIATGFSGSHNVKTGAGLIQTWIIRPDMAPSEASRRGLDASVCGACPHRGDHDADGALIPQTRSCYVTLAHGPSSVYRAYRAGAYAGMTHAGPDAISALFAGRMVRLGAYGDPAAVPYTVWQAITAHTPGHTGYTHQWREHPEFAPLVMASCDTPADRVLAKALGFRTFPSRRPWAGHAMPARCCAPPAPKRGNAQRAMLAAPVVAHLPRPAPTS